LINTDALLKIKSGLVDEMEVSGSKRANGTDPLATWEVQQLEYASMSLYLEWKVEADLGLTNMLIDSLRTERMGKIEQGEE
jgi:hypothetical protein